MSHETFVYVTYITATPHKVWEALLKGELTRQYWKHEQVSDWTLGAKWALVADDANRTVKHVGRVLECVLEKRLAVTWSAADSADPSRLVIDLEPVGDMVRLTVTHTELTPDMRQRIGGGWPRVLSSLKSLLETSRPQNVFA
jgi:uncharacterized protein YndB with AHSA1/START domain